MANTISPCPSCASMNRLSLNEQRQGRCAKCQSPLAFHSGLTELPPAKLGMSLQKAPLPVLVDFWAPWCGPCRAFAPVFQKTAQALGERLLFLKVNTEEAEGPELASFNIRSIPTLILFRDGKVLDRVSGALPEAQLRQWIEAKI